MRRSEGSCQETDAGLLPKLVRQRPRRGPTSSRSRGVSPLTEEGWRESFPTAATKRGQSASLFRDELRIGALCPSLLAGPRATGE
ncbi:unnamed protein product [Lampetra fluviatilis]